MSQQYSEQHQRLMDLIDELDVLHRSKSAAYESRIEELEAKRDELIRERDMLREQLWKKREREEKPNALDAEHIEALRKWERSREQ